MGSKAERQGIRVWVSIPDVRLRPNGKKGRPGHVSKLKNDRLVDAYWSAWAAAGGARIVQAPEYAVSIELHANPRTVNRMDADNLIASLKWDFDGIAKALQVDDRLFRAPVVTKREPEPREADRGAWIEVWAVQGKESKA